MTFKKFLADEYSTDPTGISRFATTACKLVRITRRWWRGYKMMDKAEVTIAGEQIRDKITTKPRWKLIPDEVKEEFANLERSVDMLIQANCVFSSEDADDGRQPLLTGGGNYAVDTANWPRVQQLLRRAQQAWAEAADKWCTDDGYVSFHALLKEQCGDADYERVKDLVPKATKLRRRFGLDVVVLPIKLAEDVGGDPDAEAGRRTAITELIEAAVRKPREDAAAAWRALADQLVEPHGTDLRARIYWREVGGQTVPGARRIQGKSLTAARRGTDALDRAARYLDPDLRRAAAAVAAELPKENEDGPAKALAAKMNSDDALALRVGKILLAAVAAAEDESGMCAGVAEAICSYRAASG